LELGYGKRTTDAIFTKQETDVNGYGNKGKFLYYFHYFTISCILKNH